MNGPEILSQARERLSAAVLAKRPPQPVPLDISPWLAMSLMQKAIRRGREEYALQAAATLLRDNPDRLWRRSGVIAFEDVGTADIETVSLVTAALGGKCFRARIGGEWSIASFIVSRMAQAPKCRAADDLLMTVERHPGLEKLRSELASLSTPELLKLATGSGDLTERTLAIWYAVGTNRRPSDSLS